jgi:uncharacterized protein (UPF0264 family)
VARDAGARGVLVDTADKAGPGLLGLLREDALAAWVAEAHAAGLLVALAGRLAAADLPVARALGADVAGVRGAACDGGRGGRVSPERVRALRLLCAAPPRRPPRRQPSPPSAEARWSSRSAATTRWASPAGRARAK